jgi:hypothetical protein
MSQELWYLALFFLYSFIHICIHCLGHFSPLPLTLPSPHHPLASRQNLFCPFLQFCWSVDMSNNQKDKAFLEVEIRITIKRDSQHLFNAQVYYNLNWFIYQTSLLPLGHLPIYTWVVYGIVLALLQWGHQTLSSFVFLIYPHSSHMCSLLSLWPKSNIIAFALDLKSA